MALFKPAKKRVNQNRTHGPNSEDVEGSALHNSERLGCPAKTRRPLCCKAKAELSQTHRAHQQLQGMLMKCQSFHEFLN